MAGDGDFNLAVRAIRLMQEDPMRGVLLVGGVGCGKTALASIIFSSLKGEKVRINCEDNDDVDYLVSEADAMMNGGVYNGELDDLYGGHVYLDDIGREMIRSSYGNVFDRVGAFLSRYHARGRGRLILTTNLSLGELMNRYGAPLLDRIADRCVIVNFSGKSKRDRMVLR